jgi:hypothetical protein
MAQPSTQWIHLGNFTFQTFNSLGSSITMPTAYSLPANSIIHHTYLMLNQPFTGPGLLGYDISVGNLVIPSKYLGPLFVGAFPPSPFQPVSQIGIEGAGSTSPYLGTQLEITANCTTGTLNLAVQGSCDVWIWVSSLTN